MVKMKNTNYIIDMHMHITGRSPDSKIHLAQVLSYLSSKVHAIIVTDHNFMDNLLSIKHKGFYDDIAVFEGVELSSTDGHILGYGIDGSPSYNQSAAKIVDTIHQQGGVAIAAHPFDPRRTSVGELVYEIPFDGLEINGACSKGQNHDARDAARLLDLPTIGGSDTHTISSMNRYATAFSIPINSIHDVVRAIKQKQCKAIKV